jgi:hypothetical protein
LQGDYLCVETKKKLAPKDGVYYSQWGPTVKQIILAAN